MGTKGLRGPLRFMTTRAPKIHVTSRLLAPRELPYFLPFRLSGDGKSRMDRLLAEFSRGRRHRFSVMPHLQEARKPRQGGGKKVDIAVPRLLSPIGDIPMFVRDDIRPCHSGAGF